MFSSNIYGTLWETGYAVGTYRKLMFDKTQPLHFVLQAGWRYCFEFVPLVIGEHKLLAAFIAVLFLGTSLDRVRQASKVYYDYLLFCLNLVYVIYYLYLYFVGNPFANHAPKAVVDLLFAALVSCELLLYYLSRKRFCFILGYLWLSTFLIMVPMVLINTVGPRSYFTTCISLSAFCVVLFADKIKNGKTQSWKFTACIFAICIFVFSVHYINIYHEIGKTKQERDILIQDAIRNNEQCVSLPEYPFLQYLWQPNPLNKDYEQYFRAFYSLPEDIVITFEGRGQEAIAIT